MKSHIEENNQPFDDRADLHRIVGDMVAAIARDHNGVDIDDTTTQRWRQLAGLVREVDTWADDTDVTCEKVLEGLDAFDMFRDRYPDLAPETLGSEAHGALLRRAQRILKVGEWASRQQSTKRFMALRLIEARETVYMLDDIASPRVTEQPDFRGKFIPTLQALGEAATLWDSLIDGRQDVRDGKQKLEPNLEYYVRLTGAMLARAKLGGAAVLHFAPNKHLAVMVGQRVKNRMKNGIPQYSNLHRFTRQRRDQSEK